MMVKLLRTSARWHIFAENLLQRMVLRTVYFSPTGGTKKVVDFLAEQLGMPSEPRDLTIMGTDVLNFTGDDEVLLFAAPVYSGRIAPLARERFSTIRGRGQKAIVVVVYGNRDYDDALLELCDYVSDRGFEVIAAAAFISEHSIFPAVGAGRPDAEDKEKISIFAESVLKALEDDTKVDLSIIPGVRPYRKPGAVPLHPHTMRSLCSGCGVCASECPTGAIPKAHPQRTDTGKCISCGRCISICPRDARHYRGLLYNVAARMFVRKNLARREPVWFL